MTGENNDIKLKHEIHEQIFSSIVSLPVNEFTSVMMSVRMRRSVCAVRMGIYGPGFSKGDWLIPLSRESVI